MEPTEGFRYVLTGSGTGAGFVPEELFLQAMITKAERIVTDSNNLGR
jgi:hypothetical protein